MPGLFYRRKMTEIKTDSVQNDMVVLLDYTLFVDGEELDSGPIEYLHGHGNIIQGLEDALTGMLIGQSRDVQVTAANAYGEYDQENVIRITRNSFPEDFEIELGRPLSIRDESNHVFNGSITAISEDEVEFDTNHPLAGKDLFFKTSVLDLRPATPRELEHGHVESGCSGCGSHGCADSCGDGCC